MTVDQEEEPARSAAGPGGAVDDGSGCSSCEGRGWRYATSCCRARLAEDALVLVRRRCPDCAGPVAGQTG